MDAESTLIETSPQANLEVNSPITSSESDMDWASRLDAAMDSINSETGATKYGKVDENENKTANDKKAAKISKEKTTKVSDKKASEVKISEETKATDKEGDEEDDESKNEDSDGDLKQETPKGLTEKAGIKWGELRNENRAFKKEIETLKAELEKAKATPVVDTSETERLKQINAEYERELAVARVESTQEYKTNVVTPMVDVVGFVNSLAERYELPAKSILEAMAESDSAKQSDILTDLAASMNERDRLRLYSAADDYNEIIRRRDMYQNTSRERMAQIEQQRQEELSRQQAESEKSLKEAKEAYDKATEKVFEDLKKQVSVLSDEEIASDVKRLASKDYSDAPADLKSYLAHSGALLPHVLKALKAAKTDLDKANKTIAGYRNGSPKAGGGSAETSRDLPSEIGFLEALDQQLG